MITANLTLADEAIVTSYHDVEKLLYKISHSMSGRYHIPFEDVAAQARLIFMKEYRNFNPAKARFTTHLYRGLVWQLTDWLQKEYFHRNHHELNEELVGMEDHPRSSVYDIEMLVSGEARIIINLVKQPPAHLHALMRWNKAEGSKKIQSTIREYLRDELGWESVKVSQCFEEIRTALTCV